MSYLKLEEFSNFLQYRIAENVSFIIASSSLGLEYMHNFCLNVSIIVDFG